jgi:hypothetical protein
MPGWTLPRLIVTKGVDESKQFELTGDAHSVGRDSTSWIRLNDTEAALPCRVSLHARRLSPS